LKNRLGGICATVILIAVVIFLAVDVGFSLYHPGRLTATLPACTLNIITGNIKVQAKDTLAWEEAEDGMILEPGSRVRTALDAHASLTFSQGTTTKLEPGTDIIVAKLEDNQNAQPGTVVLEQRAGQTWNQVAAQPGDREYFQIKTPSADVRVHGTLFSTEVDESGRTLIQTTEGEVNVIAQGQEVQVATGQQTEVEPGAAPSVPVPMPPAKNEMVFTINKPAIGLVIDPSGSRTGYLPDGSPLNQITSSRSSPVDKSYQTIRIPEPETGEYDIVMHAVADGNVAFSVEGFAEGNSTFIHSGTCNITSANDLILKLHLDVIDGLLQEASVLGLESSESQPTVIKTTLKTAPQEPENTTLTQTSPDSGAASKNGETLSQKLAWLRQESAGYEQRLFVTGAFIILVVIFATVWRRH
jgi:hypothetical protein